MTDRTVIAVVLPEGYTCGSDFAKDCNVEVIGTCTEEVFLRLTDAKSALLAEAETALELSSAVLLNAANRLNDFLQSDATNQAMEARQKVCAVLAKIKAATKEQ